MYLYYTIALVFCTLDICGGISLSEYLKIREKAINDEEASSFGGHLKLNKAEHIANKCLMFAKHKEIDKGFKNLTKYWPSRNFLDVRKDIERTETFKIISLMPKGAVLHTHMGTTVSLEFVFQNLTLMPNSYVCFQNNTTLFRFFETPTRNCDWQLVQDLITRDADILRKISRDLALPTSSAPQFSSQLAWSKLSGLFSAFSGLIAYRPAYERYVYRALEELYDDNVMYMEYRAPFYELYELNGTIHEPIVAVEIFQNIADEFAKTHSGFIGAKYIYTADRQSTREQFDGQVNTFLKIKRAHPDFVIGLDIADNEDVGNPDVYFAERLLEISNETKFFFHAGGTNWFGQQADENLYDAVLLNTTRIGHGFALVKHPRLLEIVKERNIALEISPTSYQVIGYYDDMRNQPASNYFARNLSIVISNDNPGLWKPFGLSYDFYEAFIGIMSSKADLRALKQLAINSIEYSELKGEEKKKAFEIWNASWSKFIKYLAYEYNSH